MESCKIQCNMGAPVRTSKPTLKLAKISGHSEGPSTLVEQVEQLRQEATRALDQAHRSALGQFMTPAPVARRMAAYFEVSRPSFRLLDAGAGVGSLTAAWVEELLSRPQRPKHLSVTVYEVDALLVKSLRRTLKLCAEACEHHEVGFEAEVRQEDFIEAGVSMLRGGLFATHRPEFDCALLNPPYRKIQSDSKERRLLESIGAGTTNLYTAFLSLAIRLLVPGGEMVAITPRSFCNGRYFRTFRADFLSTMSLRELHVFESRKAAFSGDDVLQENVIVHAVKERQQRQVIISSSSGSTEGSSTRRRVPFTHVVRPDDAEQFIRLATDELDDSGVKRLGALTHSLTDLGLTVSTGRVVDFRAREHLRPDPDPNTVPLIWPGHLADGFVSWPRKNFKKPNALAANTETEPLLVPAGTYVLVKRISAKEEKRRVSAALFEPQRIPCEQVGFENHLNYFHQDGRGMTPLLARGLALFLNSTLLDTCFRQFSGHTQVNAGDLRSLKYPDRQQLENLGRHVSDTLPAQKVIDTLIEKELFSDAGSTGPQSIPTRDEVGRSAPGADGAGHASGPAQ